MNVKVTTRYFIGTGIVSIFATLAYFSGSSVSRLLTSDSVLFFAWLLLPYITWVYLNEFRPNGFSTQIPVYIGLAITIPVIGIGFTAYALLHPDPQAGFYFFYIPFLQFMCLVLAREICIK